VAAALPLKIVPTLPKLRSPAAIEQLVWIVTRACTLTVVGAAKAVNGPVPDS
jgi:hypothetical protein